MTTGADYSEKIPNNVSLHEDRRLQRALESWQPNFLTWWESMGPTLPTRDVYLRTAVNVGREGWAHFAHVPMRRHAPSSAMKRPCWIRGVASGRLSSSSGPTRSSS